MSIIKRLFGKTKDGEQVYSYILDNGNGVSAEILNYGGIIKNLYVSDRFGKTVDVVLGYDTIEEYQENDGYLGALIGRNSNRIAKSKFELNGKTYELAKNDRENNLHGGIAGFNSKVWDVIENDGNEASIALSLTSPDGDEGFPGTLDVTVTYTITKDNSLMINYKARSDADTVCNMTNHSYFNISGHNSGTIYNQTLKLNSSFYTPNNSECMPIGEILKVDGTPFDYTSAKKLSQDINSDDEQTKMFGGFDHNFVLQGRGYRPCAEVKSDETGIKMEVYTDEPGVQLYTANSLSDRSGKSGAKYGKHKALCLETQGFPNAMAFSHFPSVILKKNEMYDTTTAYKFIVEE